MYILVREKFSEGGKFRFLRAYYKKDLKKACFCTKMEIIMRKLEQEFSATKAVNAI